MAARSRSPWKGTRIRMNRDKNREKTKANLRRTAVMATVVLTTATILTGCNNERKENELAYRQAGIECMQSGDYAGALTAFESALSQCTGSIGEMEIDICYYKAAAQYASGDMEGALATYNALVDYDKKNANAYYMRGCLQLQMGQGDGALADFASAVKYNSEDYELYINIYKNLTAYNLNTEGEEYLNQAFSIKGDGAENLAYRGEIYYLLGENENALTELNAALEKGSVDANLVLAQVYETLGDAEMAESCYKTYVDSGVADSAALCALAEIEMAKQDYAQALTYVEQGLAMEEVTNRRQLMQNQVICMEYTGDFTGAWNVACEYVTLYPDDMEMQRECIFLKNRQAAPTDVQEVQAEVVQSTEAVTPDSTEGAAQ